MSAPGGLRSSTVAIRPAHLNSRRPAIRAGDHRDQHNLLACSPLHEDGRIRLSRVERAMALRLIIGNKNYSSWSLRPWIAMKTADIVFDETVISLNAPEFKPTLLRLSGSGKVPTLVDGDVHIWES